jgi:HK97 family phage prohead protease
MKRKLKNGEKAYSSMPVSIKGIDKEAGKLTMIASTQDVDRHGDTILQAGWDLKPYKKNPVILNSHNYYDATEVIARAENTRIEGKGKRAKLIQDWVFAVNENPKAKIIFDLYAGGFLHASSVGFIPRKFAEKDDGGRDWFTIEEAELLEVSAVSVPANAAATLAKSIGIDVAELKEAVAVEDEDEETDEPENDETEDTEEVDDAETDEEPEAEEEPEETPSEKRARLKQELKELGDEDDGDDCMVSEDGDFEDEPEPTLPKKLSYNAKVLNAIHTISKQERRAYETAGAIIKSLLDEDPEGAKLDREIRAKVRKRKVNKAIRILIKSK